MSWVLPSEIVTTGGKKKKEAIERIENFCQNFAIKPKVVNGALEAAGSTPLVYGCKLKTLWLVQN